MSSVAMGLNFNLEGEDGESIESGDFGCGLSYGKFTYSDLEKSKNIVRKDETFQDEVTIKN